MFCALEEMNALVLEMTPFYVLLILTPQNAGYEMGWVIIISYACSYDFYFEGL